MRFLRHTQYTLISRRQKSIRFVQYSSTRWHHMHWNETSLIILTVLRSGRGRIIKIKQLEYEYENYTRIAKCIQSKYVKSTVLTVFLILVCSKVYTITSFVCKFSNHVCVYWFHTPELSRSLAEASDRSGLLAMTTSLKKATDSIKHGPPMLLAIECLPWYLLHQLLTSGSPFKGARGLRTFK